MRRRHCSHLVRHGTWLVILFDRHRLLYEEALLRLRVVLGQCLSTLPWLPFTTCSCFLCPFADYERTRDASGPHCVRVKSGAVCGVRVQRIRRRHAATVAAGGAFALSPAIVSYVWANVLVFLLPLCSPASIVVTVLLLCVLFADARMRADCAHGATGACHGADCR
jgi:hypothetical protein